MVQRWLVVPGEWRLWRGTGCPGSHLGSTPTGTVPAALPEPSRQCLDHSGHIACTVDICR